MISCHDCNYNFRSRLRRILVYSLFLVPFLAAGKPYAENLSNSSMMLGPLGLNTVPGARMEKTGTASVTVSAQDPYTHVSLGFQLAEPLFVNLRQTMAVPGISANPDRLYPGIDLKLRLAEESEYFPEIALGLQSATGHKRMAGEYIAASKRYLDFDFTAGIAWGRYGSAGHIDNPLGVISGHFDKNRTLDGEDPNMPGNWFTGKKAGFFGGIEYFTPLEGLSVKADIGADRYTAERTASGFDAPAPWSAGLNYRPCDWINISAGTAGGDKFFGRLSLQASVADWPGRKNSRTEPIHFRPYRTGLTLPEEMRRSAAGEGIELASFIRSRNRISAELHIDHHSSLPLQIGRAARHMANHGGKGIEELSITPVFHGLRGTETAIMRADLERALGGKNQGSPQEIWRNARSGNSNAKRNGKKSGLEERPFSTFSFKLVSSNEISLAEEDSGILYRSAILAGLRRRLASGFLNGYQLRLNLKDNLSRLRDYRPVHPLPVRSDIDVFAEKKLTLDRAYLGWLKTISNDLYGAAAAGYLEEMYNGAGGEILYRPYGKTYAAGAEIWQVFRRDPYTPLNAGLNGDHVLTGHINAWYEFPGSGLTIRTKFGRYLAGDIGATLSLNHEFKNGAKLEGFTTLTDKRDRDVFGGATHLYSGIRLSVPIGNVSPLPDGSEIRILAAPLGRNSGQTIDKPLDLYKLTGPFSHRHIYRHWNDIIQ